MDFLHNIIASLGMHLIRQRQWACHCLHVSQSVADEPDNCGGVLICLGIGLCPVAVAMESISEYFAGCHQPQLLGVSPATDKNDHMLCIAGKRSTSAVLVPWILKENRWLVLTQPDLFQCAKHSGVVSIKEVRKAGREWDPKGRKVRHPVSKWQLSCWAERTAGNTGKGRLGA